MWTQIRPDKMSSLIWIHLFDTDAIPERIFRGKNTFKKFSIRQKKVYYNTQHAKSACQKCIWNVVCLSCLLHIFANMTNESVDANSVDPDQTAPTGVLYELGLHCLTKRLQNNSTDHKSRYSKTCRKQPIKNRQNTGLKAAYSVTFDIFRNFLFSF